MFSVMIAIQSEKKGDELKTDWRPGSLTPPHLFSRWVHHLFSPRVPPPARPATANTSSKDDLQRLKHLHIVVWSPSGWTNHNGVDENGLAMPQAQGPEMDITLDSLRPSSSSKHCEKSGSESSSPASAGRNGTQLDAAWDPHGYPS